MLDASCDVSMCAEVMILAPSSQRTYAKCSFHMGTFLTQNCRCTVRHRYTAAHESGPPVRAPALAQLRHLSESSHSTSRPICTCICHFFPPFHCLPSSGHIHSNWSQMKSYRRFALDCCSNCLICWHTQTVLLRRPSDRSRLSSI